MLATISDRKFGVSSGSSSLIDHYEPHIVTAQDYYPFGMLSRVSLPGSGVAYKFGFNGKLNDNEVKGGIGSQQDYGMRIYDPRIGRFLSVDPLTKRYAWYSPYQFAGNKPIWAVDLDGAEEKLSTDQVGKSLSVTTVMSFWEVRNSITNSYMRINHDLEYEMRTDMFQKFGISDPEVIKNYQLRMRTVEISSEEKICWPCKTGVETEKTYSREWVLEPVNSAGKELLEAAIDVVNIASTLSLTKMSSNGSPILFAKGSGAFVLNSWRVSMSILYNVRRMSSIGANKLALAGVHKLENIMEAGMAFVGKNARKKYAEQGRFIGWESEDDLKLFRPPMTKQAGEAEGLIQANFQQRTSTDYNWTSKSSEAKAHMSNTHVESDQMFNFNAERRNN